MKATERLRFSGSRQHFSAVFLMQEEGGSLSLRARHCASLHLPISHPNRDFKTMPHNSHARASWRLCDRRARPNDQYD